VSGTLANENRKRGRGKGSSCAVASSQVKKVKKHDFSLQLFILRFGFFQDGDVGVGVFPESEEVLVYGAGLGGVAREGVGASPRCASEPSKKLPMKPRWSTIFWNSAAAAVPLRASR
jgi:hypothetical protein